MFVWLPAVTRLLVMIPDRFLITKLMSLSSSVIITNVTCSKNGIGGSAMT